MSGEERTGRGATAAELRAAFDEAFARPVAETARDRVALLALRAGGEPVAVRVLETAGLLAARPVVPVPSPRPELLGISGIRGAVVPIYSLARLLGRPDDGAPRWIVLAADGADRIGLAVAAFERHLVVPTAQLRPAAEGGGYAPELLQGDGAPTPVLSLPTLVRAITRR